MNGLMRFFGCLYWPIVWKILANYWLFELLDLCKFRCQVGPLYI
eukprot:UN20474